LEDALLGKKNGFGVEEEDGKLSHKKKIQDNFYFQNFNFNFHSFPKSISFTMGVQGF